MGSFDQSQLTEATIVKIEAMMWQPGLADIPFSDAARLVEGGIFLHLLATRQPTTTFDVERPYATAIPGTCAALRAY